MKNLNIDDIEVSSKLDITIDAAINKAFIHKKKLTRKKVGLVAGIAFATLLTIAFPSYAENLPIIGDIFKELNLFDSKLYSSYKEYSEELNLTAEDEGVAITINDAVFDGRTITLTFSVKSKKDLGDGFVLMKSIDIQGYSDIGYSGTSYFKRVDDLNYIGQEVYTIDDFVDNPTSEANINLSIKEIKDKDLSLKGKWSFKFKLNQNLTSEYRLNKTLEKDGAKFIADTISINEMNIFMKTYYELSDNLIIKYHNSFLSLDIKDDLGNKYSSELSNLSGDINYSYCSFTISKLQDGATKLIITPTVSFIENNNIILDNFTIDLNTLKVVDNTNITDINPPMLEDNLTIINNGNEPFKKIGFIKYKDSGIMFESSYMIYADNSLIQVGDKITDREYGKFALEITDKNDKVFKSQIFDFSNLDPKNNKFNISIEKDKNGNWCFILK